MSEIIRKGNKEDLPYVLELIQELADYEKAGDQVVNTVERMEEDGYITEAQADIAKAKPLEMREREYTKNVAADFFAEEVRCFFGFAAGDFADVFLVAILYSESFLGCFQHSH